METKAGPLGSGRAIARASVWPKSVPVGARVLCRAPRAVVVKPPARHGFSWVTRRPAVLVSRALRDSIAGRRGCLLPLGDQFFVLFGPRRLSSQRAEQLAATLHRPEGLGT